jgi:hypothetical protein
VAVKTFTLTTSVDAGPSNSALLADGVDQAAASRSPDKWTVAKLAAGNSSQYVATGIQGSGSFSLDSTTPKPPTPLTNAQVCFKSPDILTGTFAATAWTFTFAVRAATASAQAGRVRMRVFKTTSGAGTNSTELTSAVLVGTTSAALSTTADATSVITWSPGSLTLASEWLFFSLAWEITTASGNNSGDVIFRTGQAAGGTRIVTPDLSIAAAPKPRRWPSRAQQAAVLRAATR